MDSLACKDLKCLHKRDTPRKLFRITTTTTSMQGALFIFSHHSFHDIRAHGKPNQQIRNR